MLASLFFLNPFTMIIGGLLIASPIIIHLINRMRFKRIRWAAMEFLLKAQKRSRRRLIIEQLILLLLRILMVLLIALLLSRLIDLSDKPNPPPEVDKTTLNSTVHIILLDDSASMGDRWIDTEGEIGERNTPYLAADLARKAIKDRIIGVVKDDIKFQHDVVIVRTSPLTQFKDFQKLTDLSEKQIESYLADEYAPGMFHYDYVPAMQQVKALLDKIGDKSNRVVYVVSDFRASDWNQAVKQTYGNLFNFCQQAGVQVKLIDVAAPFRGDKDKVEKPVASSENLAITEFKPESRVALKNTPVEFTVTVHNYGDSTRSNVLVRVKVNGQDRADGTVPINSIPPGQSVSVRTSMLMSRTPPANAAEDERFDGFNMVSAHLDGEKSGLAIDDSRYTFVEIRDSISLLLVDNNHTQARDLAGQLTKNCESFYLYKLFTSTYRGFKVDLKTAADLEKISLQQYSAIILCDIPTLTAPALRKLDTYVQAGGGVGFFMGPSIRDPKFYNEKLYADGQGMFPAPLKEIANKDMTPQELDDIRRKHLAPTHIHGKLVVRAEARRHPALFRVYTEGNSQIISDKSIREYETAFIGVSFPRYYVVDRQKWNLNYRSVDEIKKVGTELVDKLRRNVDPFFRTELEARLEEARAAGSTELVRTLEKRLSSTANLKENPRFTEYAAPVAKFANDMEEALKYERWPALAQTVKSLLESQGTPGGMNMAVVGDMTRFWQIPEVADMRKDYASFLEQVRSLVDVVTPLIYQPNYRNIGEFEKQTRDLVNKLRRRTEEAAITADLQEALRMAQNDNERDAIQRRLNNVKKEVEKYSKYAKELKDYTDQIVSTVAKFDNPLPMLVQWLEELLEGRGFPGDPEKNIAAVASMVEFWQFPEMEDLKAEFMQLLDVIKYGDPFYIAKQYRRGRVLAFMGGAGSSGPEGNYWNCFDLPGKWYFPPLAKESMQRYLCSTTGEYNLTLGEYFDFDLEAAAFQPRAVVKFIANEKERFETVAQPILNPKEGRMVYTFKEGLKPGMYVFEFFPQAPEGASKKDYPTEDLRALACNFDTRIESNLLRARSPDLWDIAKVEKVETMSNVDTPKKKTVETVRDYGLPPEPDRDFSKSHWLFLGMLLVLILEQAWSVRLSFHVRNKVGMTPGPVTRGALA